jgi:hypothetical protein
MKAAIAGLAVIAVLAAAASAGAHYAASATGDPPRFATVVHTLQADALKIASDLQQEKDAVARTTGSGGEQACYSLFNNVDYEAVKAIAGFISNSVINDQTDMQNDINQLRANIASFNSDIASFINDGVARPAGAAKAVSDVSAAIRQTKNAANKEISSMNAAVRQAYAVADKLAVKGGCPASDRPENQLAMPVIPAVS